AAEDRGRIGKAPGEYRQHAAARHARVAGDAAGFHDFGAAAADRGADGDGAGRPDMLFTAAADRGDAGDAGENILQVLAADHRGADCHAAGDDVLPCRDVERGAGGRAFRSNLLESARNSGAGYRPAGDELSSAAGYDCANRLAAGEHVLIARIVLTKDHRAERGPGGKDILPAAAPDRGANRNAARDDLKAAA